MVKVGAEEREALLKEGERHIFSMGLGDVGSSLCRANMAYGLAKIHWAQRTLDLEPNATFISGPDETITRNTTRWHHGIGYGGKITWGDGRAGVVILDVMPNACGMLIGGLDELPNAGKLIERFNEMDAAPYINDIKVQWDFSKSNHFIDLFKVVRIADVDLPPYAFIMHSGAPEVKGDNPKGFGLYYHKSKLLREMAKIVETPFGATKVLIDDEAKRYFEFFVFADQFSKKKREMAAKALFGDYAKISNTLHQGLIKYDEILLGAQDTTDGSLLPITLRSDLPAYLFSGKKNLTDEVIESLGFAQRARKLGVYRRLKNVNILPHGGGYVFGHMLHVKNVFEQGGTRYFVMDMQNALGREIFSNTKDVPYSYRGRRVVERAIELMLGEPVAQLMPEYVLKI